MCFVEVSSYSFSFLCEWVLVDSFTDQYLQFEDVQYASRALALMSGNTLNGAVKNGIRLSYSKNPLGVRTPNAPNSAGGHNSNGSSSQVQQALTSPNQYQQHGQGQGPSPSSASSDTFQSRISDDFGGHPQHRLPTSILRRDSTLSPTSPTHSNGSGNGSNQNSFFSSPPPRFYSSVSPGATTQLTGASSAFVPRGTSLPANGLGTFGGGGGVYGGASAGFSPFGMPFGASEMQGAFGPPLVHQQMSYSQHSMPDGQHPHPQQQSQADE